jgi:hypothetical protein
VGVLFDASNTAAAHFGQCKAVRCKLYDRTAVSLPMMIRWQIFTTQETHSALQKAAHGQGVSAQPVATRPRPTLAIV